MLKAGTCLHLTLTVSKTGVSGWKVSSTSWDDEVTTGGKPGEDSEVTVIENTVGGLGATLNSFSGTKLMITGEINDADMGALKEAIKNKNITEVYITATGVTDLGKEAFSGCITLESISMPGVTGSIGDAAFSDCNTLQSISLPEMTGDIGNSTFKGCTALQSVSMPKVTGSIKYAAFEGCIALQSVSMPKVTGSIGDYAFNGCKALESINMPKATGSIGGYAFKGCTALKSISMPKAAAGIGYDAFNGCKSLESVSLPKVTSIRDYAFQGCTSLESIVLSGYDLNQNQVSLPTVGSSVFRDCPVSILFLRDVPQEIDANTVAAACQSWADVSWKAIHYDYDDLNDDTDVGSYSGHWLRP